MVRHKLRNGEIQFEFGERCSGFFLTCQFWSPTTFAQENKNLFWPASLRWFFVFFHSTSNQPVGTRYTEYTMSYIIITRGLGRIGSLFRWVDRSLCHCRIGELATASVPEVHLFSHQHCKDLQKPSKLSLLSFMHALLQASPCMIPMQIPLKLPLRCSPQIDCPTDADSTWIRDRDTCSTFMQQVSKAHQTTTPSILEKNI